MSANVDLYGALNLVRSALVPQYNEGDSKTPGMTPRGESLVALGLPPKTELVRQGAAWGCAIASGSAFTFVAGLPTTRAELALYNGEAAGGKVYLIDSVWCLGITSMAAAGSIALIAQYAAAVAALTDDAAQLITSPSGLRDGATYGGKAKRAVAVTTMTANKWQLLAPSQSGGSATAQIGLAAYAEVYGRYILKPGDTFGVNVVAGTAAGTAVMGINWFEAQLPCA